MIPVVNILGFGVARLDSTACLERIMELVARGEGQVVTANAEILYTASRNEELSEVLGQAELITADGMGVVLGSRILGKPVPERVSGVDLLQAVCERLADQGGSIFLLGAAPGVAESAADKLSKLYPGLRIAGFHHGYFSAEDEELLVDRVRSSKPNFLAVAMGLRQEYWIRRHREALACTAMGVGGSFDIIAGISRRAPRWMQRAGLEWSYRLIKQPQRFGRMKALPRFVLAVVRQRLKFEEVK